MLELNRALDGVEAPRRETRIIMQQTNQVSNMCFVSMDTMFTTYKYCVLYAMLILDRRKKYRLI